MNNTGLFKDALKVWCAKAQANKTYPLFCTYMTAKQEDCMKSQLTTSGAGYSVNNISVITDIVHKQLEYFVNQMPIFQQDPAQYANDANSDPNIPPPNQANAALTTKDIKELFKTMISDFKQPNPPNKRCNTSTKLLVAQGKDTDGHNITYWCWSHGITTNLQHTSASCNCQKEGHKTEATLCNKSNGSIERCKPHN
jgi:hypothetical protein